MITPDPASLPAASSLPGCAGDELTFDGPAPCPLPARWFVELEDGHEAEVCGPHALQAVMGPVDWCGRESVVASLRRLDAAVRPVTPGAASSDPAVIPEAHRGTGGVS